jgi:hypothetical protein
MATETIYDTKFDLILNARKLLFLSSFRNELFLNYGSILKYIDQSIYRILIVRLYSSKSYIRPLYTFLILLS